MSKKQWFMFPMVLLAAGCFEVGGPGTTDVSPAQTYRPHGSQDTWQITGSLKTALASATAALEANYVKTLTVSINGEQVIHGAICSFCDKWPSDSKYVPLTGTYRDHAVHTDCFFEGEGLVSSTTECTVFVDDEQAAKLTF
jgi:hypothetical protein